MKAKIVYFIPNIGAFWALFEIIKSVGKESVKVIFGYVFWFFFNLLYSFLFFAFIFSPMFGKEQKLSMTNDFMNKIDSLLIMHVSVEGQLPDNLNETKVLSSVMILYSQDQFINPVLNSNRSLYYKKHDAYRYTIKSVGPDGKLHTSDDIVKTSNVFKPNHIQK